jgi:hypothetical protein
MLSFKNKQAILFVLGTFLLVAAVPGQAICTCDHSTAQCCGNEPEPVEKQGCCPSSQDLESSSLPESGCSMDPVPAGRMADTNSCMHVKVLPVSTMTSAQDVSPEKTTGSAKTVCAAIGSQPEFEAPPVSVYPRPVSERDIAPPAPVYLMVASLLI